VHSEITPVLEDVVVIVVVVVVIAAATPAFARRLLEDWLSSLADESSAIYQCTVYTLAFDTNTACQAYLLTILLVPCYV
jgi:hypothetical protein